MEHGEFADIANKFAALLKDIPREWDGKNAIKEMKEGGSTQWKQMEWPGFYFEYLCEKLISVESNDELKRSVPSDIPKILLKDSRSAFGNVRFDGFHVIPWDFKTHVKSKKQEVIINDYEALEKAVKEFGAVGVIMAVGDAVLNDEDRSFQKWHDKLKGRLSTYVKERIKRGAPSRLRKTKFTLNRIIFVKIDERILKISKSFQRGFRNADGTERMPKLLLNLSDLKQSDQYIIDFEN